MSNDFAVIDLDAERQSRAAQREGKRTDLPIRVGGEVIATLPVELPLDVFAPLRELDESITLAVRGLMQAQRGGAAEKWNAAELVIDLLAAAPTLPSDVLDVVRQIGVNLLTEDGVTKLLANRPSGEDLAFFAKKVFEFYGVTLGESSAPGDSSTSDGETSSTTSSTSSDSTPGASSETPQIPTSSEPAAS